MYSRTNSVTMTVRQERFAFPGMATRSTEPEVFTFERIPTHATAVSSYVPVRPKKRCTRVMYPAKVRMHLPPPEKNQAKRWLIILCLVVLWQIYTEDACAEAPLSHAESPASDCQGFSFQNAAEQVSAPASPAATAVESVAPGTACVRAGPEAESTRGFEQSAGNSYMVALLVYHRLGGDK
ncbi:radiation-inducible immediate-early gene IEX-1 [Synchiropus splendidus]|uniref:radiation-inducible immediate-early gene IEX-1 n=1 Tax=Synchiropus splendidus TaxID=270530 RepID=UPI00237D639E|nr:radiation-inducible immediate-early gene IEX-1 [Synchiropus splendidus]